MISNIKKLHILIATILSIILYIALDSAGLDYSSLLATPLFFFTYLIFTTKSAYPLRFMYPGLIAFIFFMIIPICFTIYIAFTNLGTGHLLSKTALTEILLKEKFVNKSDRAYSFEIYTNKIGDKKILVKNKFQARLIESIEEVSLKLTKNIEKEFLDYKKMPLHDVYKISSYLKGFKFSIPGSSKTLEFYRLDKLISSQKKYHLTSNKELFDNEKQISFTSNDTKGYFQNQDTILAPGYFTNVGLFNFKKLFNSKEYRKPFLKLFSWTFSWAFLSVATTFVLGLFFALLLNDKKLTFRPIYRIFVIIPYSIPFFISVLIFKGMLNQDFGIINQLISPSGAFKLPWLADPFFAKLSCLIVNLWLGFPYMFLIITGILQSIPQSIYEAASLDGAGKFVQLKKLTLPLIMSSIGPLLVGSFAFNMNNFVGIYLLTGGGPALPNTTTPLGETDILISYTYRLAFEGGQGQDFALASSISIIIFFIVATLTIINFKITGMGKDEQA